MEQIIQDLPAVFVCNHADAYGPVIMSIYFPFTCRPWIHAHMMKPGLSASYLEMDFVRKTLGWRPPFSRWLANMLSPLCIRLFRSMGSIPVYRGQMRIRETMNTSLQVLMQGENLLIFPENPLKEYSAHLHDFHTGFVCLARNYYRETGKCLPFYPVYIDKERGFIRIGEPALYAAGMDFRAERKRILGYLRSMIHIMAVSAKEASA